jgi:ubiquinol-cytochrome c reductase cytochrome b subunit
MMALTLFGVLMISGANDIVAFQFNISLNAMTWAGRIGLLVLPPLAYYITYRVCLGLQHSDREVLDHGVETGIIKRLPHGEFIEVHQPLGPVDDHGHPEALPYQGAPVPKKMNKLGAAGRPVKGSLLTPDPSEETAALERARHDDVARDAERELTAGKPQQPTE